jgi:hypothetical protein
MLILTEFFIGIAILFVVVLILFRLLVRFLGIKDLMENGAVLTEDGVEYLRFFFVGRGKIKFDEIESARVISFPKAMLSLMFGGYAFSAYSIRTRLFSDFVELKMKRTARWFEFHFNYLLFTPKDAVAVVEQIRVRLENNNIPS